MLLMQKTQLHRKVNLLETFGAGSFMLGGLSVELGGLALSRPPLSSPCIKWGWNSSSPGGMEVRCHNTEQ